MDQIRLPMLLNPSLSYCTNESIKFIINKVNEHKKKHKNVDVDLE